MPETAHLIIDQTHSFRCVVKPSSLDHWPSQLSSWITKSQWLSLLTTDWERRAKGPYSLPLLAGSRAGVSTREATWGATPGIRAVVIFHQWWFSKCGLLNQSSSTWQLAICGNSQAPPWISPVRISGGGDLGICALVIHPRDYDVVFWLVLTIIHLYLFKVYLMYNVSSDVQHSDSVFL